MVWRDVKPWRRELREDFSFVSADLGPRDLAPLARAVSDLRCDGMGGAPGSSLNPSIFIFRGFLGGGIGNNWGIAMLMDELPAERPPHPARLRLWLFNSG